MKDGPFPNFPVYGRHSSPKFRAFAGVVVLIIFITITIIVGNYFFNNTNKKEKPKIVLTPTHAPTPGSARSASVSASITPTPTKVKLDKKLLKVQVLNGSGTKGAASKMGDMLRDAGYTISSTGNAKEFEYKETTLQIKKSKQEYQELLLADLSKEYKVSKEIELVAENTPVDAIVIVGEN